MVTVVDFVAGEVMDALDRLGIADNTLLILTSDNGARPCDVDGERWPAAIDPGQTSEETICLTDLMATCAAIVGADLPGEAGPDSYSILPALLGEALDRPIREAIVHHSLDGMFSIREGDWKLILGLGSGGFSDPRRLEPEAGGPEGQLYNLADDPAETTNVWAENPEVVERLTAVLEGYQDTGRSVPDDRGVQGKA